MRDELPPNDLVLADPPVSRPGLVLVEKPLAKPLTMMQRRARALATLRMLGVEVSEPEEVLEARVLDWDEVIERPDLLDGTLAERRRLITSRSARARYESFAQADLETSDAAPTPRRAL